MALFKILKGPETALPQVANEGWAYVTDEGNFYVDMSNDIKDRVKINKNAEYAIKADKDSKNQVIADNYIIDVLLNNSGSAPYYTLKLGNGALKDTNPTATGPDKVLLPVANASNAGVITTGTQTIAGDKTFTHTVTLSKASALNYTGIEDGSAAGARVIWFAHSSKPGTPVKNANFTFNPAATASWTGYDISTPAAYGLLNADRFNGISLQALQDSAGKNIRETYVQKIEFVQDNDVESGSLSKPIMKYTLGDDATVFKLALPLASSTAGGILSATTQTIKGKKTFSSQIVAKGGVAASADVSTTKQFKSTLADGTAPFVITSTTMSANLNADMVDGMHASNSPFGAADALNDTVPTQMAIWSSLNSLLVSASALIYKGLIDPNNSNTIPTSPIKGSVYIISAEGTFNDVFCEPGDMAIYYDANQWDIIQTNIDGAIRIKSGGSLTNVHSTDHAIPRFDGTSGRVLQNSKVGIDDSGNVVPDTAGSATAGQTLGSSAKPWKAVYGLSFSGLANQATHDDGNNVIKTHYIADIIYNESASAPTYSLKQGNGTIRTDKLTIPVASASVAGVITADTANTQILTGPKEFDSNGSVKITKTDGFTYSGLATYSSTNASMYLWFSTSGGTPKRNANLKFNPKAADATTGDWIDYATSGNYNVITADRLLGLAHKALKDDSGQTIKKTYIKDVVLTNHATAPYYTLTLGNGLAKDIDGNGADQVLLPVASATYAGVITTGAQTLTGAKTLNSSGSLKIQKANGLIYEGIQEQTAANTALYLWFSEVGTGKGIPKYAKGLSYNPKATVKWEGKETSNTTASVLTVNRIEGLAHNALADDQGLVIKNTYVKTIKFVNVASTNTPNAASKPWLQYTLGNGTSHTYLQLPIADSSDDDNAKWLGGIVTLDTQVFSGHKTFRSGVKFLDKQFDYAGMEQATSSATRNVWFSDSAVRGKPCYSNNFTYNPAASVKWGAYDSANVSVSLLTVPRIEGMARKALEDSQGLIIDDTYIKTIAYVIDNVATVAPDAKTNPYLKYTLGNGSSHTYVKMPAATSSRGGILTASAQTITGSKTFETELIASARQGFNFSGIEKGTSNADRPVWFAWAGINGTPVYDDAFVYNPAASSQWGKETAAITGGVLTVPRLNGLAYKAVNDEAGQCINTTYIKGLSLSNNKFTITMGSGTTSTFNLVIPVNPAASDISGYKAGQMWIVTT